MPQVTIYQHDLPLITNALWRRGFVLGSNKHWSNLCPASWQLLELIVPPLVTHNPRVLLSCFCNFALSFFLKILSKHKCNSDPSTNPYSGSLGKTISIKSLLSPAFKTEETLKFSRVTMIQSKARQQQQDRHNIQTRDSQESRVFQVTISSNLFHVLAMSPLKALTWGEFARYAPRIKIYWSSKYADLWWSALNHAAILSSPKAYVIRFIFNSIYQCFFSAKNHSPTWRPGTNIRIMFPSIFRFRCKDDY